MRDRFGGDRKWSCPNRLRIVTAGAQTDCIVTHQAGKIHLRGPAKVASGLHPVPDIRMHDGPQFPQPTFEQTSDGGVALAHPFDDLRKRQAFHVAKSNRLGLRFGQLVKRLQQRNDSLRTNRHPAGTGRTSGQLLNPASDGVLGRRDRLDFIR